MVLYLSTLLLLDLTLWYLHCWTAFLSSQGRFPLAFWTGDGTYFPFRIGLACS